MVLPTERDVAFGSESRGFFTGTAAAVVYTLSHPRYGGLEVTLQWENPFMGSSSVAASVCFASQDPFRCISTMEFLYLCLSMRFDEGSLLSFGPLKPPMRPQVTKGGPLRVTKRMSVGHNNQTIFTVEETSRAER